MRVGDKVVFTGCESFNRDALEARASRLGVRVLGNVSRRVSLLVSDGTMDGTKAADARALGTRIVHPRDFMVLLDHLQPAMPSARLRPAPEKPVATAAARSAAPTTEPDAGPLLAAPTVAPSVIRAWAREAGFEVGERGRLHADVIAAYHRANPSP